jgi:hypothetical protein
MKPLLGDKDRSVYQSCIDAEVEARQKVIGSWSTFQSGAQSICVRETQIGGVPSYVDLLTCLQLSKDATSLSR